MSQRLKGANKKDTPKPRVNGDQSTDARAKRNMAGKEVRHHMISTAAYYRAEQHGFEGVYELQDWLEAEAEIDVKFYH